MNRLLIYDTKLLQRIIREYIEESAENKELFVSILQIGNTRTYERVISFISLSLVASSLPQLFCLVKNYENNFEDNTLRWVLPSSIPPFTLLG